MIVEALHRFDKDIDKLDATHALRVELVILALSAAQTLQDVPNVKKIQGTDFAYRIRVGDYRIGLLLIDDNTVELHRVLHRSKIYNYFP
jgi:mRNA interferase RelE/StbE